MTISAAKLQSGQKKPQEGQLRQIVAFDGGNRFLKWFDSQGNRKIIPSHIKQLEDWEEALPGERSVIVEHEGTRYAIGQIAQELGGTPVFSQDKCELAEILGLVALEPNPSFDSMLVETMRVALPDARRSQSVTALKRLEGTREFTRNGQRIVCTVRRVEPVDETRPAYKYAITNNLFKYPDAVNGVLDWGGGTGIARLYSPGGTANRQADVVVPGTSALAQAVAAALAPKFEYSPDLSLIMDGIERGNFAYGTTDICFRSQFLKAQESCIADIRGKLKTAWAKEFSRLGEVLVIGGSATLAQPMCETSQGRIKIATHSTISNFSQFISLYGMALEG